MTVMSADSTRWIKKLIKYQPQADSIPARYFLTTHLIIGEHFYPGYIDAMTGCLPDDVQPLPTKDSIEWDCVVLEHFPTDRPIWTPPSDEEMASKKAKKTKKAKRAKQKHW